jgi:hypothetical protein
MSRFVGIFSFALGVALAVLVPGSVARADHFSNDALVDVEFGPEDATGGTSLDFNRAEFRAGIYPSGGCFYGGCQNYSGANPRDNTNGKSVYSFRSVDGSFSNSNGVTRVFVEWLMTEPDSWKRSNKSASFSQKSFVKVRAILYPGTVSNSDEVESCGVKAQTKHDEFNSIPTDVKIQLKCKKTVWDELGFSVGQIEQIQSALGKGTSLSYIWSAP